MILPRAPLSSVRRRAALVLLFMLWAEVSFCRHRGGRRRGSLTMHVTAPLLDVPANTYRGWHNAPWEIPDDEARRTS